MTGYERDAACLHIQEAGKYGPLHPATSLFQLPGVVIHNHALEGGPGSRFYVCPLDF